MVVMRIGTSPLNPNLQRVQATLARGKLTEPILDVFVLTGHERLLERIRQLDIKPLPPIIGSTRKLWLGDKPSLY